VIVPEDLLKGKNVLLGVTGSISAYKSAELVRLFIKSGASVRVVMSEGAKKFITPLTLETLSRNKVLDEESESWADDHNHINSVEWADLFLIAPATAHTLNKLAHGLADNLLTQCALADPKPKLLAPAANTHMIHNLLTQESIQKLKKANYYLVATQTKELACQTTGDGALADPEQIFFSAARLLLKDGFWQDRRVIVTGGGTVEKIDDVRYLSNFSSGKMASAVATALYLKGADVELIATRHETVLPPFELTSVQDSSQMLERIEQSIHNAQNSTKEPYLFMAAAVSDFVPETPQDGKIKKRDIGEQWELTLKQNVDILSTLSKEQIKTVAFKAEMDSQNALHNASSLIDVKEVDAVCLNLLENAQSFGTTTNQVDFITASGIHKLPTQDKLSLSLQILDLAREI
jgi:phosphopantothenoylcysteine decarboxylase/phosphopantothenate--cysteine ligase